MARIISSVDASRIQNRGERQVFTALEQHLPNHFLVFYHLPFLRKHLEGENLVDGEMDFLILDQQRGVLLALEVKQGAIERRIIGNRTIWYQNEHQMDEDPWSQARKNKYALLDWLYGKLDCRKETFPLSHGHAVLLPDVHTNVQSPMPDIAEDVALTWSTDEELASRVEQCCEAWLMKGRREPSEHQIELVRQSLMPSVVYGNTLRDRIGVERQELVNNTEQLNQLLDFIGNRKQARIAGCAGAGKTMLAVAKAKELAGQGKHVLILVYNTGIAGYLTEHLRGIPSISVQTLGVFCRWCCERAGIDVPKMITGDSAGWWNQASEMLEAALTAKPTGYDALIVDEAQDFQCAVWLALERAIKPDGWYYIFYDLAQNVFGGDLQFPIQEQPFLLLRNCRSTQAIIDAVNTRTGLNLIPRSNLPTGEAIREESAAAPGQRRKLLGKILHDWVKKEGLTENQIVILGGHSLKHTCMAEHDTAGSFRIVERGMAAPGVVPYYTYMAFKGCESDAVILLDVDPNDNRWNKDGLYTAMTRARHLLGMISVNPARNEPPIHPEVSSPA